MKKFISQLSSILTHTERTRLLVLAGCDIVMGIADIAFLVIMLLLIRLYTANTSVTVLPVYMKWLPAYHPVMVTGICLLLFVIKSIIGVWLSKEQYQFVSGVSSRLSWQNITNYLKDSYAQFINVNSSQRVRHISQVPIEFGTYILTNFQQIIAQSMLIIFTVAAILWYHPALFILLLLLLVPPVLLLGWAVKQKLRQVRTQIKTNSARVIQYLQEALNGYVESNIYGKHNFFAGRYHRQQRLMNNNIAALQTLQGMSSRFFEVFAFMGFFILIAVNKIYGGKSTIDMLTIGVFMAAAYKIIPGMVKILNSAGQIKTYHFLLDELAMDGSKHHSSGWVSNNTGSVKSISFQDVYFNYKSKPVLSGVSFEMQVGDMVGLSGMSGSGKTTIVNLLLGFLKQDAGLITINDTVVDNDSRKSYWPHVAYVKQQGFFINDTILKNITLSNEPPQQERLKQALTISGLDVLLQGDPAGLQKIILEHGKNISGGQRQRLSLARALYHDFDLLILDEPFSEMDEEAEHQLLHRLKLLGGNKIILLITHNTQSLAFCNKIISPYAVQV